MKKYILFALSLFMVAIVISIIFSIIRQKNIPQNISPESPPELISFISDFMAENPDLHQNDIIHEQLMNYFKILFVVNLKKGGLLDSIPLKLTEVAEYRLGKYAVKLSYNSYDNRELYIKNRTINFELNFDVIGLISDSLVYHIQNESKYYIKGNFIEFPNHKKYGFLRRFYSPFVEIRKDYFGSLEVTLGIMLFEIEEMNLVNQ